MSQLGDGPWVTYLDIILKAPISHAGVLYAVITPLNGATLTTGKAYFEQYTRYHDYAWDHDNRLTGVEVYEPPAWDSSATMGDILGTVDFDYDAFGNRIEKAVWSNASEYIFRTLSVQDRGQVPIEYMLVNYTDSQLGDGLYKENYYLWDPSRVDRLISSEQAAYTETYDPETFEWALLDHQGTVLGHIERPHASGVPDFDEIKYDPFGRPEGEFDWEADPGDDPYPELFYVTRYAGREFDFETGLQYNRARYYNPTGSRWMSEDPMGFGAGDANLYRYVGNSPSNATDPSGEIIVCGSIAIGLGIAGAASYWRAAHQYDEASAVLSQAGMTQEMASEFNRLAGSGARWETTGRIAGTAAFVVAAAPLMTHLYSGAGGGAAHLFGGGTATKFVVGAVAVGVTDKVIVDSALHFSGVDEHALSRYRDNPYQTAGEFGISIATAGLAHGGDDIARILATTNGNAARRLAYRGVLRSGMAGRMMPQGMSAAVREAARVGLEARHARTAGQRIAASSAKGYELLQCSQCANNIANNLDEAGEAYARIMLQPPVAGLEDMAMFLRNGILYDDSMTKIMSAKHGFIGNWHTAIIKDGLIFDNLNPNGILPLNWLNDLSTGGSLSIQVI